MYPFSPSSLLLECVNIVCSDHKKLHSFTDGLIMACKSVSVVKFPLSLKPHPSSVKPALLLSPRATLVYTVDNTIAIYSHALRSMRVSMFESQCHVNKSE